MKSKCYPFYRKSMTGTLPDFFSYVWNSRGTKVTSTYWGLNDMTDMQPRMHFLEGFFISMKISPKGVFKCLIDNQHHWCRWWLGVEYAKKHYFNQWWLRSAMPHGVTRTHLTSIRQKSLQKIQFSIKLTVQHDDVIKWKHFPRHWPFVWGIHRSPVNSLHKGQWRGALMFSLICSWLKAWVNNRETGDLRHHRAHNDVFIMEYHNISHGCLLCCPFI